MRFLFNPLRGNVNKNRFSVNCPWYSTYFLPRFNYEIFTYREHRPFIEQRILTDSTFDDDAKQQYNELLAETKAFLDRYLPNQKLTIFCSYARPLLQEFQAEFWHEPFLAQFCVDLKRVGFSPLLDLLNYNKIPLEKFMQEGIWHSDFVLLSGSQSLMHKLDSDFYSAALVRTEINYLSERLNKTPAKDRNFLLGVKLTHLPFSKSFPNYFRGRCDVFEFTDDQGHSCKSYLQYFLKVVRSMLSGRLSDKEFEELELIWQKKLASMSILNNTYLSEENFQSIIELYRKKDRIAEINFHEYSAQLAERIDYTPLGVDAKQVAGYIRKHYRVQFWNFPNIPTDFNSMSRTEELKWVNDKIVQQKSPLILGFYGLPGVGIIELIRKWLDENLYFDAILRFDASSEDILCAQYSDFAKEFKISPDIQVSLKSFAKSFRNYFENQIPYHRWLVIFDNVENFELIRESIPKSGNSCVMLIAANNDSLTLKINAADILEVPQLKFEDAIEFFKKLTGSDHESQEDLEKIVKVLGCLPIALHTAAHWMKRRNNMSTRNFLKDFDNMKNVDTFSTPLATLWDMMLKGFKKSKDKDTIIGVLKVIAYLAPDKIPEQLIRGIINNISSSFSDAHIRVIDSLRSNCVLAESRINGYNYFYINRLMQKFLRSRYELSCSHKKKNYLKFVDANAVMELLITHVNYDASSMQLSVESDLLPHAEAFLKQVESSKLQIEVHKNGFLCELYFATGQLTASKSEHLKALYYYEKARSHLPDQRGEYKIHHAIGQSYLAMHRHSTDYLTAETYLRHAIELARKFGDTSLSDYAAILNDLARLQYDMGKYNESIASCKEVIEIYPKIKHKVSETSLAYVKHDLGMACLAVGNFEDAETEYQESLSIKMRIYGHKPFPTIAATNLGLGQVRYLKNDIKNAIIYFSRSLKISQECFPEHTYPKSHTGVAAAYNDVACCEFKSGNILNSFQNFYLSLKIYLNISNQVRNVDSAIVIHNFALLALFMDDLNLGRGFLIHAFFACKDAIDDGHTVKEHIKHQRNLYFNKEAESFVVSDNIETLVNQLQSRIKTYTVSSDKSLKLDKIDLLLSNRYGLFRAIKPQLTSRDETKDQGLNLFLSNSN